MPSISSSTKRDMTFVTPSLSSDPETELWLDLRPTAIHPKAAMDHLENQLGTDSFVNRIILSEKMFQDLIDYSDLYLSASQILYHDTANDTIFFSTGRGLSFPFGRFYAAPPDAAVVVEDPIPAIEVIASGKWVFLGNNHDNGDNDDREMLRMNAVGDFLGIATTASGLALWGSSANDDSGLVLPSRGDSSSEQDEDGRGGVAVTCSTKSAVMKLASALRLARPGAMTSMTDSGIIVQSTNQIASKLGTAAVLPFEVELWQAALLVFGAQGLAEIEQ
ncbi:hypothetical protein IV203_034992 [Nitzschia inconspicua]|uniref:Uncharacterized protein n=1 Tax=Nitzschia inconspicua TaxID=303405 RepID=A0A9K3PWQ1_9STRA|nr:hypothetical protein IV203_034992 [Nitzschia inconspicua]